MKYVSLDIETTGLDSKNTQVIQIAAVVDDLTSPISELPKFTAFVNWPQLKCEPYALKMHVQSGLMLRYLDDKNKLDLWDTLRALGEFLDVYNPISGKTKRTIAGKNVAGFDLPFIRENFRQTGPWLTAPDAPSIKNVLDTFSHRVIDPGTSFTDFYRDTNVASLDVCKDRAKTSNVPVSHDALDDALDVVQVVRKIAANNQFLMSIPQPRTT